MTAVDRSGIVALLREVSLLQASLVRTLAGLTPTPEHPGSSSAAEEVERIACVISELRGAIVSHPVAAASVVRVLTDLGERFAATPEGERWQRSLAGARPMAELRLLWDAATSGVLDDVEDDIPPAWSELVADVVAERADVSSALTDGAGYR